MSVHYINITTKFDVHEMVHGAVAVEVFADIYAGACICSTLRLGDAPEHPGKKMVSVSFSPLQPLTRFATHACNIAPHAAFFLMRHDKPCFAEFFDYLRYEDPYLFDVDLCGNDAEFRRAARLALDVMGKNRDLWYTKADDAWTYWARRLGFDPDDLSFLDPEPRGGGAVA